jgi:HEAT repeat protein
MAANLHSVLADLASEQKRLPGSGLKALSNLAAPEAEHVQQTWARLSVQRRRELIARLADLAEDDVELNFDPIFAFCLDDADSVVRRRSIDALWESEDRRLIAPLIQHLVHDLDESVRAAAAQGLGRFVLLGATSDRLRPADLERIQTALLGVIADRVQPAEIRRRAIEAISAGQHPKIPGIIEEAYHSDDPRMRVSALHAMGRTFDQRWLPVLLEELRSDNPEFRYEAAEACGELEAQSAVPNLVTLIDDPDPEVQTSAILALGQIGGSVARPVLQRLLHHAEERIRETAEEALDAMTFEDNPLGFELN